MKALCTYENGHYQIGIPWRDGCPDLPNNSSMTLSRLKCFGKRLLADPRLLAKYKEKVEDLILQGHAVEVLHNSAQLKGRKWYIPHHCVTSKFRVVFDAATQFQQTSLNDQIFSRS